MKKNDIAQLIKSAKQGKQRAITELYNQTKDYAYRVARQYVPEPDIADAVQEAYISVFRTLATFDDTKDFTPWLHTIVKNKCIDLLKRNNKQAFVSDNIVDSFEDTAPLPMILLENKQKRSDILAIINGLTVGQRTTVMLYYLEGMSIKEISDELGVTDGTVKRQLYLAKHAIKEAVLMEESEHDNKLYGVGAVPFLTKLLTSEVEQGAYTMPQALSAEVFGGVMSGIAASGVIAGGSLGGLIGMTVGGKVVVAAITTIAVVSTAGAGYFYMENEKAAVATAAINIQMEELTEQVNQQSEVIKTLEDKLVYTGMNAASPDGAPGASGNSPWIVGPDGIPVKNPYFDPELPTTEPEVVAPEAEVPAAPEVPAKPETPATPDVPATPPSKPANPTAANSGGMTDEEKWALADKVTGGAGVDGSGTLTNPDDEGLLRGN